MKCTNNPQTNCGNTHKRKPETEVTPRAKKNDHQETHSSCHWQYQRILPVVRKLVSVGKHVSVKESHRQAAIQPVAPSRYFQSESRVVAFAPSYSLLYRKVWMFKITNCAGVPRPCC